MYVLNPKLEADSSLIYHLPLCEVRLSHNARFPWVILVPKIANVIEIIDLTKAQQIQLLAEMSNTCHILKSLVSPDKLNVANLGNLVSQLHIHVIARFENDLAWPNPVWNSGIYQDYEPGETQVLIAKIATAFENNTLD